MTDQSQANIIRSDNIDVGFLILQQQYAKKFDLPINNDIWQKRGLFSQVILDKVLQDDQK